MYYNAVKDITNSTCKGDGKVTFVSLSVRLVVKKGSHYKGRQSRFAHHLHNIIMFTCWYSLAFFRRCIQWVSYVSANFKYKIYLTIYDSGPSYYDCTQLMGISQLSFYHLLITSAVEVNFNENSYTVAESDCQVSVSLRIDGQFFIPVWAVVEISDGTATGGLCMSLRM